MTPNQIHLINSFAQKFCALPSHFDIINPVYKKLDMEFVVII